VALGPNTIRSAEVPSRSAAAARAAATVASVAWLAANAPSALEMPRR
jgi:hypothetical protein